MPDRSSKDKKRPRDVNQLAAFLVREATDDTPDEERAIEPEKNPHAAALGRLGGLKGGQARAEKLTPEQRREIARKAAQARWTQP